MYRAGTTLTSSQAAALDLCSTFNRQDWSHAISVMVSMCSMPDNLESGSNLASKSSMVKSFCQPSVVDGAQVPGGVAGPSLQSADMFAFLANPNKLLTFSSNAPMTIAWTTSVDTVSGFTKASSMSNAGSTEQVTEFGMAAGAALNTAVTLTGEYAYITANDKSQNSEQTVDRTVTIVLDDADQGDYFAIRLAEDPVYGTPVFFTVGGQSKCPGETGTSRRESNVRINRIIHRCGADRKSICDELTLQNPDDVAYLGVVIQNLSPTEDDVSYTVGLSSSFDAYHGDNYRNDDNEGHCGTPGQRSGLVADFMETELDGIPFNVEIEVPFAVSKSGLCNAFTDIEVSISATCEMGSSSSNVYQYGVIYNESTHTTQTVYDADHLITAAEDTAKFSLVWAEDDARRRRLSRDAMAPVDAEDKQEELLNMMGDLQDQLADMRFLIVALVLVMFAMVAWMFVSVKKEGSRLDLGK